MLAAPLWQQSEGFGDKNPVLAANLHSMSTYVLGVIVDTVYRWLHAPP
jgi:hypothetical protein